MSNAEKAVTKIKKVLLEYYPNLSDYHTVTSIQIMIEYYEKLNGAENPGYWLTFDEHSRVKDWNSIRDQIRYDIIEKDIGYVYDYKNDEDENDYIRGVLAAIHLIEHRVHCICD